MYATCAACRLQHVIYAVRNGVHMTRQPSPDSPLQQKDPLVPHSLHLVDVPSGFVMLDAGSKASVGGAEWHKALQAELASLGMDYASEDAVEYFRFGDGTTVASVRTWVCPLALSGTLANIRIAEIPGSLPGLLSPEATGQFGLQLDFAKQRWRVPDGDWKPIQHTASGHIRLPMLQYPNAAHVAHDADSVSDSAESDSHDSADEMCNGQP